MANGTEMSYQWQHMRPIDRHMVQYFPCDKRLLSFSTDTHRQRCIIPLYRYFFLRVGHKHGRVADVFQKGQINLACKKFAKCTSFEGTDMTAAAAVDDDSSTRWGGNYKTDPNKDSAWIYVDLGAVFTIDSVFINWEHSGAKEYYVQAADVASDNDQGWTNVAHITDGNAWENGPSKSCRPRHGLCA